MLWGGWEIEVQDFRDEFFWAADKHDERGWEKNESAGGASLEPG
jgi:hypothetical protein